MAESLIQPFHRLKIYDCPAFERHNAGLSIGGRREALIFILDAVFCIVLDRRQLLLGSLIEIKGFIRCGLRLSWPVNSARTGIIT